MKISIESSEEKRMTRIGEAEILDARFMQHRSGKTFIRYLYKDLLKLLAKDMHENVKNDYDNVVMCCGGEGSGKSVLVYWLLREFNGGEPFDIASAYTYNMDVLRERFGQGDFGCGMFWMDETTQIASNRTWQSEDNQDFVSVLETFRSKKMLFAGCAPKIERVDIYLREFRMRYLLICMPQKFPKFGKMQRGCFELQKRNPDTGEMEHVGYGLYPDMPPEDKQIYLKCKEDNQERLRLKIANRDQNKGQKYKTMYESSQKNLNNIMVELHDRKLVDDQDLMRMFGYTNRGTYQNALSKARQLAKAGKDDE